MQQGNLFNPRTDTMFQKDIENKDPLHLKVTLDSISVYRGR